VERVARDENLHLQMDLAPLLCVSFDDTPGDLGARLA
jgi:hypothetical protein